MVRLVLSWKELYRLGPWHMLSPLSKLLSCRTSHPLIPVNPLGLSPNAASSRSVSVTVPPRVWVGCSSSVLPEQPRAPGRALVSLRPSSWFVPLLQ